VLPYRCIENVVYIKNRSY